MSKNFNEIVCRSLGRDAPVKTSLYSEPGSKAHASQGGIFGGIGWNLEYWQGWNVRNFRDSDTPDSYMNNFIETWSHEFGHILERGGFSHNPSFYKKQAEAMSRLMYGREKVDAVV